jgi:nitrite reductase/ring-hydroxylating ferredoxin subunit
MATISSTRFVRAASEADVHASGCLVVSADGHTIALFSDRGKVRAVDNRCPHMGFPLHRGSLHDGILTCHWHHARFDLCSGGTFDEWAGDLRAFPVELRDGHVWIDVAPHVDHRAHPHRLRDGLERNLPLVIAKSVIALADREPNAAFAAGLTRGVVGRYDGWQTGLTILSCMRNMLPRLDPVDRPRALYHGLAAVADDCHGRPPRHPITPLPGAEGRDPDEIERWLREFVEVRDADGAERAIVSAVRSGATSQRVAAMLYAAATDHRYLRAGHLLDFTTKALEALDHIGWDMAESVLGSLAVSYATADRAEESNQWRHPIDLVEIVDDAFTKLVSALRVPRDRGWRAPSHLTETLLGDDPHASCDALMAALAAGAEPTAVASEVSYAAALRIARFPISNEFSDWITALHTFSFANAVEQGLRRTGSVPLVRGIFDAAMSVHLDRFLNVPSKRLPTGTSSVSDEDFLRLLDNQQRVEEAGGLVWQWMAGGANPARVITILGRALLREDRDFHTIQMVEAAMRQHDLLEGDRSIHVLVAAARYLAAHAPTARAQGQTFEIAWRLRSGARLYEDAP